MAGIARTMGANLTAAQNCFAKIKICDLQFLQLVLCSMQPLTAKLYQQRP